MRIITFLITTLFLTIILSCASSQQNENTELYANENGQIELSKENDTLMRAIIKNNDGDVIDTVLSIDPYIKTNYDSDILSYLQFGIAGIEIYKEYVKVIEILCVENKAQGIKIEHLYNRPFYKIGKNITLNGDVRFGKGGSTIDGIYFSDSPKLKEGYFAVTGTIKKALLYCKAKSF